MPQKQGAVNQQGQRERAVVAQNRGSVVLFWVPTLKEAVPPLGGDQNLEEVPGN